MVSNVRNKVSLTKIKQLAAELRKVYLEDEAVFGVESFGLRFSNLCSKLKIYPNRDYIHSSDHITLKYDDALVSIHLKVKDFLVESIQVKVTKEYTY